MKFLSSSQLSEHRYKTPQGYLVCLDCVLARTGQQQYRMHDLFEDGDETEVFVDRPHDEVFSDKTLASFENQAFTNEHPNNDVNSENYKELSVGFVRDIRKGNENGKDVMIGNIIVTDPDTIAQIESNEKNELSCGYECDVVKDDNGEYKQVNIRGNHVALCEHGRAGNARIVDSKVNDMEIVKGKTYNTVSGARLTITELNPTISDYNGTPEIGISYNYELPNGQKGRAKCLSHDFFVMMHDKHLLDSKINDDKEGINPRSYDSIQDRDKSYITFVYPGATLYEIGYGIKPVKVLKVNENASNDIYVETKSGLKYWTKSSNYGGANKYFMTPQEFDRKYGKDSINDASSFFYKCVANGQYYISHDPNKIRRLSPKCVYTLEWVNNNFIDMVDGKRRYFNNEIGDPEAVKAYASRFPIMHILDAVCESIHDEYVVRKTEIKQPNFLQKAKSLGFDVEETSVEYILRGGNDEMYKNLMKDASYTEAEIKEAARKLHEQKPYLSIQECYEQVKNNIKNSDYLLDNVDGMGMINEYTHRITLNHLQETFNNVMRKGDDVSVKILEGELLKLIEDYNECINNPKLDKNITKKYFDDYKRLVKHYENSKISPKFSSAVKNFVNSIRDSLPSEIVDVAKIAKATIDAKKVKDALPGVDEKLFYKIINEVPYAEKKLNEGNLNWLKTIANKYSANAHTFYQVMAYWYGGSKALEYDKKLGLKDSKMKDATSNECIEKIKTTSIPEGMQFQYGDMKTTLVQIQNTGINNVSIDLTGKTPTTTKTASYGWGRIWKQGKLIFNEKDALNIVRAHMIEKLRMMQDSTKVKDASWDKVMQSKNYTGYSPKIFGKASSTMTADEVKSRYGSQSSLYEFDNSTTKAFIINENKPTLANCWLDYPQAHYNELGTAYKISDDGKKHVVYYYD